MPKQLPITIPQAAVWLLRLAVNPVLSRSLQNDPVAFSAWYATVGGIIDWPDEVVRIQEQERAKRLSLDRMMKLLSQINYVFCGRTNAEHARLVLEGYAVHDWVGRHPREFMAFATEVLEKLLDLRSTSALVDETASPFSSRITELGRTLQLSPLEQDILSFAFLTTVSDELSGIFEQLASDRWTAGVLWTALFDTSLDDLAKAMRSHSPLRLSGLLQAGRRAQFATVAAFWVDLLAGADSLTDALLEPLDQKTGSGKPARLLEEDLTLAINLLKNAREPGVNLLLYGDSSLDKRQLLSVMVTGAGRIAWRVRRFEEAPRGVLPSLTYVAFQLLAGKDGSAVLVIERPSEVLHTAPSQFFRALFGIEISPDDSLPFDQNLLSTNRVPAVWLSSDIASLPDDSVARFVFHAPLKKAERSAQQQEIKQRLKRLRLGKAAAEQILTLDGVSSPQQILKSFRRRAKGSVLLYGPPGTGKTQFTEHLASELKLPLVSKSAAALLSKWLGDSEKNIAAAFEEAGAEDAILFFDEGDSFLRSRELAQHSWEVTQTNELLQRMERFEGIVVVATNLFRNLDTAALRRFTFKIEFRELDLSQRWKMFLAEAGLTQTIATVDPQEKEKWEKRLLFMRYLTPGDFATVKRQCLVLDTPLTPDEWLEQLEIECEIKNTSPRAEAR
ncbi:MAG: ATPase [Gammaproteobacteria bacterium]|nr:ATPase [Gammaproteobacteria bacterium]